MAKEVVHTGRVSWWNGRYHALCGLVVEGANAQRTWFRKVTCPGCIAAKK
ncbi:hypothetical protein ABZ345_34150 [Lentzea sp. NPDC005914]